jgi:hypothetical protein
MTRHCTCCGKPFEPRPQVPGQARPTANGNGTRANHGRKRPCACAKEKKLAPISREERAERMATGDVPARP